MAVYFLDFLLGTMKLVYVLIAGSSGLLGCILKAGLSKRISYVRFLHKLIYIINFERLCYVGR